MFTQKRKKKAINKVYSIFYTTNSIALFGYCIKQVGPKF